MLAFRISEIKQNDFIRPDWFSSRGFFIASKAGWGMSQMFKDMSLQSYLWSLGSGVFGFFTNQHNLMLLSLAIGVMTALANAYHKCQEGRFQKREFERAEELHQVKMARLRKGLDDGGE